MPREHKQHMADYRKRNPEYDRRQKKLEKARRETLRRLAELYPAEYERIYNEIKARENLL